LAIGDITERWVVQKRSLTDGSITWSVELSSVNTLNFYPKTISVAEDGVWIAGSVGDSAITNRSGYVEKRDKTTGALLSAFYIIGGTSALLDGINSSPSITFIAGSKLELTGDWKWYMAAIGASDSENADDLMHHLKWFEDNVFRGDYLLARAKYHSYTAAEPSTHSILSPVIPVGNSTGSVDVIYPYLVAFTRCDSNHSVQIRMDWGDTIISDWMDAESSPITIPYHWAAAGVYAIKAQAMCRNTGVLSAWSDAFSVTVSALPSVLDPVTIPVVAVSLPWNANKSLTFETGQKLNYILKVSEIARRMQIAMIPNIVSIGVKYTFKFPDGVRQFQGVLTYNSSIPLDFRAQSDESPNISEQYMPFGDYQLSFEALSESTLELTPLLYVDSLAVPEPVSDPAPVDGEVLPWNWGSDGQIHEIYGSVGQKKTYIFRVPSGTKVAGGNFYAYYPTSKFNFVFKCAAGYKYYGFAEYTGQVTYSGDLGIALTSETITPTPTDGFVPPGDYLVEITWVGSGPIMITTARRELIPVPLGAEVLPWGLGLGSTYTVSGSPGQKKTYIIRVLPGTKYARAYFQAWIPTSSFEVTFKCPIGYKYWGYEISTHTVRYSSAADFQLYPGSITPVTGVFIPAGDYILEITWIGTGPILITTSYM